MINVHREYLLSTISDVYKEVYGFRPRSYNFESWSTEDLDKFYDELSEDAKEQYKEEKKASIKAVAKFKELLATFQNGSVPIDPDTVLRWVFEGYYSDYTDSPTDFEVDGFFYHHGIAYTDYAKEIQPKLLTIAEELWKRNKDQDLNKLVEGNLEIEAYLEQYGDNYNK
jgi:hypothetical protein